MDRSPPARPKPQGVITSGPAQLKAAAEESRDPYADEDESGRFYIAAARTAYKKARTKMELRKWAKDEGATRAKLLTPVAQRALLAEVTAYAETLPESTVEAA